MLHDGGSCQGAFPERLGDGLHPAGNVHGWSNNGEIEAFAGAYISVTELPDIEERDEVEAFRIAPG